MNNNIKVASYIDPEIPKYNGHPLINALPPINSPEATAKFLYQYPKITDEEKDLPSHIKRHAMMRILDKFLFPTKMHLHLEQTISSMIRSGYLSRNISDNTYLKTLNSSEQISQTNNYRNAGNEALVSSVIGCSGAGKSTAVEAILHSYEQTIYHPEFQHVQLVWLKLECPHDGSVKSLCINFFRAVDRALHTDYQEIYVKARSSAESMLGDMARVAALHSIGILVIDEIQHLNHAKSGGSQKLLNFFVALTNVIKIPVLFIGTPKAKNVFTPTMRSARRAAQFGSINWGRLERSTDPTKKNEWEKFFSRLWKLQWFKHSIPLTQNIADLFWEYTQGIAHIAVILFYLCQVRAIISGRELIDKKLITKVYHDELSMVHPMINALRSGREEEINKFSDLDLPLKEVVIYQQEQDFNNEESEESTHEKQDKYSQLCALLENLNIGSDLSPILAKQAINENPEADLLDLVSKIKELKAPNKTNKKTEKSTHKSIYIENDLRLLIDENPEKNYQSFNNNNVIINLKDYI